MPTIQPQSLTDRELVVQAQYMLDKGETLPTEWQQELVKRLDYHLYGKSYLRA